MKIIYHSRYGNIIYFKFVSYIIAKSYDGYYITIKSNDKNIVENLKELKKIAIGRLKGGNSKGCS